MEHFRTSSTDWTTRFLAVARVVAGWSKDPGHRVGAVIVRPNRTIVSVGYNGFPRGTDDYHQLLNDRDTKLKRTVHAEVNAMCIEDDLNLYPSDTLITQLRLLQETK